MTSGTNRKKGTITKGKKTGKRSENTAIRRIQLVRQIATHLIAIALKYTLKQNSSARRARPSKLVVTIAQTKAQIY